MITSKSILSTVPHELTAENPKKSMIERHRKLPSNSLRLQEMGSLDSKILGEHAPRPPPRSMQRLQRCLGNDGLQHPPPGQKFWLRHCALISHLHIKGRKRFTGRRFPWDGSWWGQRGRGLPVPPSALSTLDQGDTLPEYRPCTQSRSYASCPQPPIDVGRTAPYRSLRPCPHRDPFASGF